jgi:hypothetical protein
VIGLKVRWAAVDTSFSADLAQVERMISSGVLEGDKKRQGPVALLDEDAILNARMDGRMVEENTRSMPVVTVG